MSSYCSLQLDKNRQTLTVTLSGAWTVVSLPEARRQLAALVVDGVRDVIFLGEKLTVFDTSAAWCLDTLVRQLHAAGIVVALHGFQEKHLRIYERVVALPHAAEAPKKKPHPAVAFAVATGEHFIGLWRDCCRGVGFLGAFLVNLPLGILHPRRLRLRSVVFHINEVGIKATPIIALMSFAIAFVTGYQGAFQLQKFDATIYTVDLIVLSGLREMGVLITAIMLAGRSGSAFAAQIGTMKLNEEVDALQTMGVSPFEMLVLPRLLAILISLPLLTVVADMASLLGGYVFSYSYLGYSYVQFHSRVQEAADMQQFYVGLCKAPVFAVLIGIVGCMQGLQASGSAEDVGRKTITAVVQAIFLVIAADAIFSVIFTRLGI